mmetsp:Transcript_94955/g.245241  ORF Transcript_94955/g.245241 Transcript_94955/m.245241 type:complete len:338 (+) Transcript_94955:839-1852(+)
MQHPVALVVHHREALRAHQLLRLLAEDRGANVQALVAQGRHADLRGRVLPAVPIEVALPEALNAEVVQAVVAREGGRVVLALLAPLLRLDDVAIGHVHEHRLGRLLVALALDVVEALEAEVVIVLGTEELRLLDGAVRAQAAAGGLDERVVFPRPQGALMEGVGAGLAEGHQALVALQRGLHHPAGLAGDLQVAERLVEEHLRLLEEQPIHGGLRAQAEKVQALPLQDLEVPLSEWVLNRVVVVHRVVKVADTRLAHLHLCVGRHRRRQHLPSNPGQLRLERQVDAQVGHELHRRELVLPRRDLQGPAALRLLEEVVCGLVQASPDALGLAAENRPR